MPQDYFSIELQRDELNRYFGGGIPKNSLILIEGKDGSGKSILCQRFIFSLLKKGQTVSYISTELNTLDFINQLESVDYGVREFILNNQLLFIPMFPFMANVKLEEDFLDKIMSSKKIFESEILIFDTLSFLFVKQNAPESKYFDVINFFRKLNNLNKTIIFTVDPTHLNEKFLSLLRGVCDLYLSLFVPEGAGENVKIIEIKRFKRPFDIYVSKIPFRVEPKEGVIIEIGSYA